MLGGGDQFVGVFHIHGNGRSPWFPQLEEIDQTLEDVHLEHDRFAFGRFDFRVGRWEFLHGFHVLVQLEIQTALELAALPSQLARIQRQLLVTCCTRRHRTKVLEPRRATQLAATHPNAPHARGLLTGADLAHVDTNVEGAGQLTHQFAEIHPLLRGVVKGGPSVVALELHVGQLHANAQALDDLTGGFERVVFAGAGLVPKGDVVRVRLSVDALQLMVVLDLAKLHLRFDELPRQTHHANVVAWLQVDDHHVTHMAGDGARLPHVSRAVVFESDLHHVVGGHSIGQRHTLEPIEHRHGTASTRATSPVALASPRQSITPLAARRTSHVTKLIHRTSIFTSRQPQELVNLQTHLDEDQLAVDIAGHVGVCLFQACPQFKDVAVVDEGLELVQEA